MNEVIKNIKERHSCRKYKSDMIPDNILNEIVEAGTYAASGMNKQSPIIVVIKNKEMRDKLAKLNAKIMGMDNFDPFYNAPVIVVVLANKDVGTYLYDGSLVMANLMLAATSLNIGSCWIHRAKEEFETEEGKAILNEIGITGNYEGIGHCILGYPDEELKTHSIKKEYVYEIN